MLVFLVQEDQHLLRQVFGNIPLHMTCREGHHPFAQFEKDLLAFHACLPDDPPIITAKTAVQRFQDNMGLNESFDT
jgi:hypothetical protein